MNSEITVATGETYTGTVSEFVLSGLAWIRVVSLGGSQENMLAPGTVTRIRVLTPAEVAAYKARPQVEDITSRICSALAIAEPVVMSGDRHQAVAEARFLIWHCMREVGYSTNQIAREFKRDHGAVCNGLRRAKDMIDTEARLAGIVQGVLSKK
jgi:chromosomal replication initiation ATPase DnaA